MIVGDQGCARPFPFTFTGRPQQLDSMLGQFAFETTAEVVLVADESLSGALSQKLAFGCQEVKEGLAFVGLGPGQGEGDGQALKGADQVQAQPLVVAGLPGQVGEEVALHRAKIRLADEVLVVGDYIGDSTRAEIAYARSLGKPVRFTHPEVDPDA